MDPLDVHHVSVCVTDIAAARAFYVDVLGFRERTDRPDFGFPGAWFDVGGRQVHLLSAGLHLAGVKPRGQALGRRIQVALGRPAPLGPVLGRRAKRREEQT